MYSLSIPEDTVEQQAEDSETNPNKHGNVVNDVERGKDGCDEHDRCAIRGKSTYVDTMYIRILNSHVQPF